MNQEEWKQAKGRVYFHTATLDDRFVFEEIIPSPDTDDIAGVLETGGGAYVWADGLSRYRLTGCVHKHRDGSGKCSMCGDVQ